MFGPWAAYFPVSLCQGCNIVTMLYSCCLPVLFYQLLNNIGLCEYGTKLSGISERTSYQINLQHRVLT